ncbi:TlpA family protein disulfide reductase [Longispora urticae]
MESLLAAAVLILAAIVLLNLVLTFAVIRRLRDGATAGPAAPGVGDPVPTFATTMTDGATLTHRDLLVGPATVVFALPGCAPCTRTLAALPGAEPTFVFVMGEPGGETEAVLAKVPFFARAGVTPMDGPVGRAFGVALFPTTLRVADGVIREVDNGVAAGAGV